MPLPCRDRTPQGDPETVVILPRGGTLLGLYIKGVSGTSMLGIREDVEGQPVSCAIGEVVEVDTSTHSNPRRVADHDHDWDEDDGA